MAYKEDFDFCQAVIRQTRYSLFSVVMGVNTWEQAIKEQHQAVSQIADRIEYAAWPDGFRRAVRKLYPKTEAWARNRVHMQEARGL